MLDPEQVGELVGDRVAEFELVLSSGSGAVCRDEDPALLVGVHVALVDLLCDTEGSFERRQVDIGEADRCPFVRGLAFIVEENLIAVGVNDFLRFEVEEYARVLADFGAPRGDVYVDILAGERHVVGGERAREDVHGGEVALGRFFGDECDVQARVVFGDLIDEFLDAHVAVVVVLEAEIGGEEAHPRFLFHDDERVVRVIGVADRLILLLLCFGRGPEVEVHDLLSERKAREREGHGTGCKQAGDRHGGSP